MRRDLRLEVTTGDPRGVIWRLPTGLTWAGEQQVFFAQGLPRMAPRVMPGFGRSLRAYQPNP
ncbi:MAG: hypothetical protein OEN01_07525 [Candidatus Krumholzibacteria bacterium]|nr:hypothetical protein [Candidatus Krumholzibacteria bacterium]